MDRFEAMRVFCKVAETANFSQTARELGLSPPAVTRLIASLETMIGTRLLIRTTRSVKLTEAGRGYFDDCRRILVDLGEAEASAAGSFMKPTGTLTVTAPVLFGQLHVLPVLTGFLAQHPAVSGRALFLDRPTSLIEEGIDVAVRIGHLPDSGLIAKRVGAVRRVICAAPGYLAKHGRPSRPEALVDHVIVAPTNAWTSTEWTFGGAKATKVTLAPRLFCNLNGPAIDAAVAGWGVTRVLSYQVAKLVAAGALEIILEDFEDAPLPVHVVHAEGHRPTAKIRGFVDCLTDALRVNPCLLH